MQIFFIYDISYCKSDEDDPKNAVIFFYPLETCETQRYTLCCQLVGVAQFLKRTFSSLSNVVLDHARFVFHHCNNFLFVLGENYDIECAILRKQLMYLYEAFNFYYGDITSFYKDCGDRQIFLDKMMLIWTNFMSASQSTDGQSRISFAAMPCCVVNQNSKICRKASKLLQMCQINSSVIAGSVFCKNFMLSTQLTPELTSYLSLLPYVCSFATSDTLPMKNLPPGVELKHIHLSKEQLEKVMNYNHKNVGNIIRLQNKTCSTRSSFCSCDSMNSGSEADVESEYCDENRLKKREAQLRADPSPSQIDSGCYSNASLIDTGQDKSKPESELFQGFSQGKHVTSGIGDSKDNHKIDCEVLVKDRNAHRKSPLKSRKGRLSETLQVLRRKSLLTGSSNLICGNHATCRASHFTSSSTSNQHLLDNSCCDLEFSCHLCTHTFENSTSSNFMKSKMWNSDIFLSQFPHQKDAEFHFLTQRLCFSNLVDRYHSVCKRKKKLQILNCRHPCNSSRHEIKKFHHSTHRTRQVDQSKLCDIRTFSQFPTFKKNHILKSAKQNLNPQNVEKSRSQNSLSCSKEELLHKVLLLNHRCGESNLVLLLSDSCDKKVINYVWNCGFSSLKDLELAVKRNVFDEEKADPNFQIFLYDALRKTLTNYPQIYNLSIMEQYDHESLLLKIHQDFSSNSALSSICLLTSGKSIFAQQYKHHHLMYLQKEDPSRKLGALNSLILKAAYRFTKGFNNILKH